MGQQLQTSPEATFTLQIEAGNGPLATTSAFGGWRDGEDIGSVDDSVDCYQCDGDYSNPMCWNVRSLIHKNCPAQLRSPQACQRPHLRGHLVRFSLGLEAVADLQADLEQALRAALA